MPTRGDRAAIYRRVSTEKQAEKHSLPAQERILRELAGSRGFTVVEDFVDAGISGATLAGRPAFLRLLAAAAEKRFDYLLTIDLDRISRSRDLRTWAEVLEVLREGDIRILTPGQELDPDKPEDIFLTHIFGAVAALEKSKIAQRARRGLEEAVRSGQRIGGTAPYGYRYDKNLKKLVVVPEEADALRLMFDLYEKGWSQKRIADELEARGMRPRTGDKWWRSFIRNILLSPACTGYATWNRTTTKTGKFESRPRDAWIWSEEPAHEVIIDRDRWERCLAVRKRRGGTKKAPRRPDSSYFLTGLIRCWCGERMAGRTCRYRSVSGEIIPYRYYQCSATERGGRNHPAVRADEVEAFVIDRIAALAESPEFLDRARRQILLDRMRTNTSAAKDLDALRTELAEVQSKQALLYEDRLEGRIALPQWERFNAGLVEREAALVAEIEAQERDLISAAGGPADVARLLDVLGRFREVFATLDPLDRKQVVAGIVAAVQVREGRRKRPEVGLLAPWSGLAKETAADIQDRAASQRRAL